MKPTGSQVWDTLKKWRGLNCASFVNFRTFEMFYLKILLKFLKGQSSHIGEKKTPVQRELGKLLGSACVKIIAPYVQPPLR